MTEKSNGSSYLPFLAASAVGALVGGGIVLALAPSIMSERIVRTALTDKPELLVEASEALESKRYAQTLAPMRTQLLQPFHSSWKGSDKPAVTLVYFYDYACGYCRQSNPDLERLIKENSDLRVVYRELPILGPESVTAARVSLAAAKAGKWAQYHDALYEAGRPSAETIAVAAQAAGVSPTPTNDPAQEAELRANTGFASQLGATGTPLFVVGNQVFNSAVGYDALKRAVDKARKG